MDDEVKQTRHDTDPKERMMRPLIKKLTKIAKRVLGLNNLGSVIDDGISFETTTWSIQCAMHDAYRLGWKDAAKAARKAAGDAAYYSLLRSLNR